MKVEARVVVERHHLSLRVLSHDPGRTVLLGQHSHRNHNYFGVCVKNKDQCVHLIELDLFPVGAQPVPIFWEHIKRIHHKDNEEPPSVRPEKEITEGEDVDNTAKDKSRGKQLHHQVRQGASGHGYHWHQEC